MYTNGNLHAAQIQARQETFHQQARDHARAKAVRAARRQEDRSARQGRQLPGRPGFALVVRARVAGITARLRSPRGANPGSGSPLPARLR